MMTNQSRTVLYIGVANDLANRVSEHRYQVHADSFTARYRLNRLVWYELFHDVRDAISREKQLKRWRREKKEWLINEMNPKWEDLAVTRLGMSPPPKESELGDEGEELR